MDGWHWFLLICHTSDICFYSGVTMCMVSMWKNLWLLYHNWKFSSNWVIYWEHRGTNSWTLLLSAELQMWMISSACVHCQINQKTVTIIIRKYQCCALYSCGRMHKTSFFIKLDHFAPKDGNNHCYSVMVGKWIDGTLMFWYFAWCTVNLILIQKS